MTSLHDGFVLKRIIVCARKSVYVMDSGKFEVIIKNHCFCLEKVIIGVFTLDLKVIAVISHSTWNLKLVFENSGYLRFRKLYGTIIFEELKEPGIRT